jgi:hypothetical protein
MSGAGDSRAELAAGLHHVVPVAAGGAADATNIELRCRAHNLYEAELFFGADTVRESHVPWG